MSGCYATTVLRCDSRADFDVCLCCGYSAAGEHFGICPYSGYSAAAEIPFGAACPWSSRFLTQGTYIFVLKRERTDRYNRNPIGPLVYNSLHST